MSQISFPYHFWCWVIFKIAVFLSAFRKENLKTVITSVDHLRTCPKPRPSHRHKLGSKDIFPRSHRQNLGFKDYFSVEDKFRSISFLSWISPLVLKMPQVQLMHTRTRIIMFLVFPSCRLLKAPRSVSSVHSLIWTAKGVRGNSWSSAAKSTARSKSKSDIIWCWQDCEILRVCESNMPSEGDKVWICLVMVMCFLCIHMCVYLSLRGRESENGGVGEGSSP